MRALAPLLLAAAFCLTSFGSWASTPTSTLLQRAEVVRSSDPVQFQRLLRELDAREDLSSTQREQREYLRAYAEAYAGRYQRAAAMAQRLAAKSDDPKIKFRASALMVNSYAATRQYTPGLRMLDQVLLMLDRIEDPELRHHGLIVAAVFHNQIGQYAQAQRYAERVLAEQASPRTRCFAAQHRLEALAFQAKLPADDAPIFDSIRHCSDQGEKVVANFMRNILARKWAEHARRKDAIEFLQQYMDQVESTRFPRLIAEFHSSLAEFLLAEGQPVAAEPHANIAIEQSKPTPYSLPLVVAYRTMYEIAERRGDSVAALQHYRNYAEADKAYLNDVKAREMAYQIVRQETLQQWQKIELLNRQNQVLQLQQRVDRQAAQNTRVIIVLLLALLASIAFWAYKVKRLQLSLRHRAETDALTGICNRQHFTLLAEQALARCARTGEGAALIMFDLDLFKSINDRFGHDTGDWGLKRVADTCRAFCRQIDLFGRLGGEEFAILLYGCDLRAAKRIADDCRARIAAIDTRDSGHRFSITASFGVTDTSMSGYDLAKLLSHADLVLYRAKREGRNRVRVFARDTAMQMQPQTMSDGEQTQEQGSALASGEPLGT